MGKILSAFAIAAIGLGVAGGTAQEKDANCSVGSKTLKGSNRLYKISGLPVATHFNYAVREGSAETASFSHGSWIFNVDSNSKTGERMAERFCATGVMPLPTYSNPDIIPKLKLN